MEFKRSPWSLYGVAHAGWLAFCKAVTRLFFPSCRLVRLPVFIRGRKHIVFGSGFVCGYMARLDAFGGPGCIEFGRNVELNDYVHIGAVQKVSIGNDVLIASRVFITDHGHGIYDSTPQASSPDTPPQERTEFAEPVRIGDRVWIGEGVTILAGVQIGDGAVIGAGAVVTKDIPPDTLAAGVPARVLRRYDRTAGGWIDLPR